MDSKETTEALVAKMRAGIKAEYEISLRELVIPVRVLSVDEINAIRREARTMMVRTSGDETDMNLHIQKTTLTMASTPVGGVPLLSEPFYKAARMSVDEVNYLYNEYIRVLDNVNPSLESLSHDEFRALVEALKKNSVSSSELSLRQLKAICTAFQDLIQRQASPTSQQDN